MPEQPWFKMWAQEALLSDDLASLSDNERSIWLYLLCASSLAEPRWHIAISRSLARKCYTTEARMASALNHMAERGMVELRNGEAFLVTAAKWNEDRKRYPSDAPDATRDRKRKQRGHEMSHEDVTSRDIEASRVLRAREEAEQEEEQEEETETEPPAVVAATAAAEPKPCERQVLDAWTNETGLLVTPAQAARMVSALDTYGLDDVLGAIAETGTAGVKRWNYTVSILERWKEQGRVKQTKRERMRYG